MAIAETLKVTNRVDIKVDKVDGKVDKVDGKVDKVDGKVDKVDGKVDKVDDTVNRMDDTVNRVDDTVNRTDNTVNRVADKVTVLFDGGQNPSLFLFYAFLNMHVTANVTVAFARVNTRRVWASPGSSRSPADWW